MIWTDVTPRVNLALKITNWCNLCCAHCCERSAPNKPRSVMPVESVRKYVEQYKDMDVPVWDYVTFTGGESMAPCLWGDEKYIPTVADICARNELSATFKTNAKWGEQLFVSNRILKDLADMAHRHDRMIALDISIDEYHDNLNAVSNVINQIMNSQYLSAAILVSVVGLNTPGAQYRYQELVNRLKQFEIFVAPMDSDGSFIISKGNNTNVMFYEIGGLTKLGRAADNNITNAQPVQDDTFTDNDDCLMLTNDNTAVLNHRYKTAVDNKSVKQIYNELLQKKR